MMKLIKRELSFEDSHPFFNFVHDLETNFLVLSTRSYTNAFQ